MKSKKYKNLIGIIKLLILVFIAFVMIYPLMWMIVSSLRPGIEIFNVSQRTNQFTFANYIKGWKGPSGVSFSIYYRNSFAMVFLVIVGNLLSCSLTAYTLARLSFKGNKLFFAIMLGLMMIPYYTVLIPRYIFFNKLGWMNTLLPIVVPKFFATDGFFIFLMIQFMRNIPFEYDQSAEIDGCNSFGVFAKIIVPLSVPVIITTIIFSFIWSWNDFLTQLIYLSRPENMTVSLGLRLFLDATGKSNWGAMLAMSAASLIPMFLIFVTCQRFLVDGLTAGGLKG